MKTIISKKRTNKAFKIYRSQGTILFSLSSKFRSVFFIVVVLSSLVILEACKKDNSNPVRSSNIMANEALGRAFVGAFNIQSPIEQRVALEKIMDSNYLQHNSILPNGRAYTIGFIGSLKSSFTGLTTTVREVIATEDKVIVRSTIEGKLTGAPFLGVAATGQNIQFDLMDEWTVRNGLLYEHWDQIDWPRCFVQLGIQGLPAPFVEAAAQPIDR